MNRQFIFIAFISLILGCNSANSTRPEQVALAFFSAVYIEKDLDQAVSYVDETIAEVMRHYALPTQIQRHMLGLNLDNVSISILDVEADFFRRSTSDVIVLIHLEGDKGHRKWQDDRRVKVSYLNDTWVITHLYLDQLRQR